ncbi:Alpha/Beta hydrolase protein [Zopfochytrium polystomum]|nr:Alpha/Beta hydrolase protein [Zopfochytrium polystomum]
MATNSWPRLTPLPPIFPFSATVFVHIFRNLPVQTHYVQISDGTILTLHRIPCRRSSPTSPPEERPSPAVLVWHGIGLSSNAWVCSPGDRESNLAFVLADAGYDVWLANARGSEYTRRRRRRDSLAEQPTWDFSIDEAAHLDVPAVVDYVLEVTGLSSISYIGYSQGTTAIFAALSVNDELNSKLNVAIAMAPALKPKKPRTTLVGSLLRSFGGPDGLYSVFGRGSFIGFARNFKNYMPGRLHVALLDTAFKNVLEWEVHRLGSTQRRAALYYHLFSGTSMKNVVHWFQVIEAGGSFQHYVDRRSSWSDSFVHTSHKISHPIKYPTKHIKTPLHLFVGTKDHISDCDHLREHLPRQTNFHMVDDYTHMDFLWATDVKECVWDNVLDVLSKANELPISE